MLASLIAAVLLIFLGGFYLFICKVGYKRGYYRGYYDGNFFGVEDAQEEHQKKMLQAEADRRRKRQAAIKQANYLRVLK